MKKILLSLCLATVFSALSIPLAIADSDYIPASAVPLIKVVSNLQSLGYKSILEVEFDDGIYQAKVINNQGQEVKLNINPQTGKVNPKPIVTEPTTMLAAIKNTQKAGYQDICEAKFEHGIYKIKAYNKNKQKVKVIIDSQNGTIIRTSLDD